jgi:hypothetical protein
MTNHGQATQTQNLKACDLGTLRLFGAVRQSIGKQRAVPASRYLTIRLSSFQEPFSSRWSAQSLGSIGCERPSDACLATAELM